MKEIRFASEEDAEGLLQIYAYYVKHTPVTFEYEVPAVTEFQERVREIIRDYPYLVYCEGQRILGYAYAHRYLSRAAFSWDVELSVYLSQEAQGQGIGSALYSRLIALLKLQGFYNAYALITYPNDKSIRLHEKMGFQKAGLYRKTGYKFGQWHDLLLMDLELAAKNVPVEKWKGINDLEAEAVKKVFDLYLENSYKKT